jgi:hypothetical protein
VSGELQMETLILSTATWFALHQKELTNILEEWKCFQQELTNILEE